MQRDIVHILHNVGRGGIETWLMHVFRASKEIRDRSMICLADPGPVTTEGYADEIRSMGIPLHAAPFSATAASFILTLRSLLKKLRPHILHAHTNHVAGFATLAAKMASVPVRIAHYHVSFPKEHETPLKRLYTRLVRRLERWTATHVLACSALVMESFAGRRWAEDPKRSVLYYGIDFAPFAQPVDPREVRLELGIPLDAFVIGHVGRFDLQKNHDFLVDIAAETHRLNPTTWLLLVSDGRLRPQIERKVENLGIRDRVTFAGLRSDVPRLMLGAMDVFLFPSLYEGLGIVIIEAQAAGLRCIYSDAIPPEAGVIPALTRQLPLSVGPLPWAQVAAEAFKTPAPMNQADALAVMMESKFSIATCIQRLEEVYRR